MNAVTGAYTYTLDNSAAAVQALGAGGSATETFKVEATDGINTTTAQDLTFTINGVNDAPVLTVASDGSVTEDAIVSTITGTLLGSDPEDDDLTYLISGETAVLGNYNVVNTYGTLSLNAVTGAYTYTLDNSAAAVQALGAGGAATETLKVQATDGINTTTAQDLTFTINGVNDAPTISITTPLITDEDTTIDLIPPTVNDVDTVEALSYIYGPPSKGIITNNNGFYTYTPNLNENGNDSFTISASDGELETIETINLEIIPINDDIFFIDYINRIETTEEIQIQQTDINTIEIPKLTLNFANLEIGLNGDRTFETPSLVFETNRLSENFDEAITSEIQITLIEDLGVEGTLSNLREGDEREIILAFETQTSIGSDNIIITENSTDLSVSYTTNRLSSKLNLENRQHQTFNYYENNSDENFYEINIFDVINSFGETIRPLLPLYENAVYFYEVNNVPFVSNDLDSSSILFGQFEII